MKNQDSAEKNTDQTRRRRSFLAVKQSGDTETSVTPFPTATEEEDIPVLTEIVHDPIFGTSTSQVFTPQVAPAPANSVSLNVPTVPPIPAISSMLATPPPQMPELSLEVPITADTAFSADMEAAKTQAEELANQMMQAISKQMAYELPSLIEATLMSVSVELRTGIMATMDAALRDFVASRKK